MNKATTCVMCVIATMMLTSLPADVMSFSDTLALGVATREGRTERGYMECGDGVKLCGVLTLETGKGDGNYQHKEPSVHGLWPQTGKYGTSACVKPSESAASPSTVYECYAVSGDPKSALVAFETHEWTKHGECAGVKDADDFFNQVCALALDPLKRMALSINAKEDLQGIAQDMQQAGFPVFAIDEEHAQVELSVCADDDGVWKLSTMKEMKYNCSKPKESRISDQ